MSAARDDAARSGLTAPSIRRRRSWATVIASVGLLVGSIIVAVTSGGQLAAGVGSLVGAEREWLLVACLLVPIGVLTRSLETWLAYRAVGTSRPVSSTIGLSASAHSANKLVKAGGGSGLVVHLSDGETRGFERAEVMAAYIATRVTTIVAVMAVAGVAVSAVAVERSVGIPALPLATLACVTLILAGLAIGYTVHPGPFGAGGTDASPPAAARAEHAATRRIVRLWRELRAGAAALRSRPRQLLPVAAMGFATKVLGAITLVAVLGALRLQVGASELLLTYGVASLASSIGPLPGGVGLAEASTALVLRQGGLSSVDAVNAAITFRLLDLWLPVAIGAVAWLCRPRLRPERNQHLATCCEDSDRQVPV